MDQRFFSSPFAVNGDRAVIPGPNQFDGSVSFDDGFGFDYQRELGVDPDAKAFPRGPTNYLFYALTEAVGQYQKTGIPEFITSADNGGAPFSYGRGVMVRYKAGPGDPFVTYVSLAEANISNPASVENWTPWIFEPATDEDTASTDRLATPAYVTARLAAFSVSVPPATTLVSGRTRYATDAESIAGLEPSAAVTPVSLAATATNKGWGVGAATVAVSGRTRYATGAETATGVIDNAAVTPAGLAAAIPQATAAVAGRTRYASVPESDAAVIDNAAVTPAGLAQRAKLGANVTFGIVTATGYDTGSSRKIKSIFAGPFPYGMRQVLRLRPVVGVYKPDYLPAGAENRKRLFLIAEDAMRQVPESVDPIGTAYRGERVPTLDYQQFVPVLISALQEEHRARVVWQRVTAAAVVLSLVWHVVGG